MPDPNRQMLVAQKQRKPRNRRQIQQPESNEGADHPPSADPELAFNIALRESWEKDARDCLSLEERLNRDKLRRQAGEDLLRDLCELPPTPLHCLLELITLITCAAVHLRYRQEEIYQDSPCALAT
ncbi:hypothetical protein J056_004736 [Wallemia ichthyophaga EXF-994]|uniref:Uncharacterized protein n=1 Tax=Wallemia ichthyophaga (strain EXF-994 / CBS 113033) TaxID=1299270 RepID=R9AFB8_WALI9|nr:uncharacterized protein J056_004736 [Wallemia ichthyophaga EXF-994]EOR00924.1 hypothetical protein J056_004736 [Wallemia ichthyophaga EXF-994]